MSGLAKELRRRAAALLEAARIVEDMEGSVTTEQKTPYPSVTTEAKSLKEAAKEAARHTGPMGSDRTCAACREKLDAPGDAYMSAGIKPLCRDCFEKREGWKRAGFL